MAKRRGKNEGSTIIIRRVEEGGGGHHGGAWKVAYADFVTAMMAFFLLMWLINATSEQQRRGIAAYFSPMAQVENGFSGAGLVPGGVSPLDKGTSLVMKGTGTPPSPVQTQQSTAQAASSPTADDADADAAGATAGDDDEEGAGSKPGAGPAQASASTNLAAGAATDAAAGALPDAGAGKAGMAAPASRNEAAAEDHALSRATARIRQLVGADASLAAFSNQMAIDLTPEGLRIQIMDSEQQPMFARGSVALNARAEALLRKVGPFLATLPEPVSIDGYSDAAPLPPGSVSNWTLSSGRANNARDVLVGAGLPDGRVSEVTGYADRHLLLPGNPLAGANRRIVLTLRRLHPAPAPGHGS